MEKRFSVCVLETSPVPSKWLFLVEHLVNTLAYDLLGLGPEHATGVLLGPQLWKAPLQPPWNGKVGEERHSPCPWDPDSTHSQSGKRIRAFLCPLGKDTWVGQGRGRLETSLHSLQGGRGSCPVEESSLLSPKKNMYPLLTWPRGINM